MALAVSAAFTAPAAHALTFEYDEATTFELYGTLEPKVISEKDAGGDSEAEIDDEDSTLGFAVEHVFNERFTGFAQLELEHSSDDTSDFTATDSAFLGLKGAFGKFRIGNFDSVYEDDIIDATEVAEDAEITDEQFASEDNQIAYYSPSFNGFSVQSQLRFVGEGEGVAGGDSGTGFSVVGSYAAEIWEVHVGYDDTGAEVVDVFDASGNDTGVDEFADEGTYGTAAIVSLGDFELAGKLALQDLEDNDPRGDDISFTAVRGTYRYGPGKVYAAVQEVDPDAARDRTEVTLGWKHPVFDHLDIWAEAGDFDRANSEGNNYMIGAIYSF